MDTNELQVNFALSKSGNATAKAALRQKMGQEGFTDRQIAVMLSLDPEIAAKISLRAGDLDVCKSFNLSAAHFAHQRAKDLGHYLPGNFSEGSEVAGGDSTPPLDPWVSLDVSEADMEVLRTLNAAQAKVVLKVLSGTEGPE